MYSIVNQKEADVKELQPLLPDDCADSIRACLQKDPRKRPASFDGMIDSFTNYLFDLGIRDVDKMLVQFIHNGNRAAAELSGFLAQYHLRKGNDYLDAGIKGNSEMHFREAEKFGAQNMSETGASRSPSGVLPNLKPAARSIFVRINKLPRIAGVNPRLVKATVFATGIIALAVLGFASVSVVSKRNRSDQKVDSTAFYALARPVRPESTAVPIATAPDTVVEKIADVAQPQPQSQSPDRRRNSAAGTKTVSRKSAGATVAASHRSFAKENEARYGTLRVTLAPSQAHVFLDGASVGTGELLAGKRLKAGVHIIAATAEGYKSFSSTVTLETNAIVDVPVYLKPMEKGAGFLHVYSYPWADIFIDGNFEGTTPTPKPLALADGDHQVILKREGFKDFSQTIHVAGGEVTRIKVQLSQ